MESHPLTPEIVAVVKAEEPTMAEALLYLAERIALPKNALTLPPKDITDVELARIVVALDLYRRGSLFILRAVSEDWDYQRLVREMY